MATTIPGGKYLGEDGKTWHDANGKVITEPMRPALRADAPSTPTAPAIPSVPPADSKPIKGKSK